MEKSFKGQITLVETYSGNSSIISLYSDQEQVFKFIDKEKNTLLFSPTSLLIKQKTENSSGSIFQGNITIPEDQIEERKKITVEILMHDEVSWKEIDYNIFKNGLYDKQNNLNINFQILNSINQGLENEQLIYRIDDFFKYDSIIKITKQCPGMEFLTIFFPVTFGMNKDMANLSLEANGIYASINKSGLLFDVNGLTITNSGFQIIKKEKDDIGLGIPVLSTDKQGNLFIKGHIEASSGLFNGKIQATSGSLGQLSVLNSLVINSDENKMYIGNTCYEENIDPIDSQQKYYIYNSDTDSYVEFKEDPLTVTQTLYVAKKIDGIKSSNYIENEKGFFININGDINASNIKLGAGATIADKISIGSGNRCQIMNPDLNNGKYILVQDENLNPIFSLDNNGKISLGTISLYGSSNTISTNNFSEGKGWFISPDKAIFNNVTVKGTIETSVFKYGEINSVGGLIFVRPSSIVRSIQETLEPHTITIYLEDVRGFHEDGYCLFNEKESSNRYYFRIITVNGSNNTIVASPPSDFASSQHESIINQPLIYLGLLETDNNEGSIGICINGSDAVDSFMPSRAISIFTQGRKPGDYNNKIILGKIPNSSEYGQFKNTYGLVAENALLKGSLVTRTQEDEPSYSGISTIYTGYTENSRAPTTKTDEGMMLFPGAKYMKNGIEGWHLGEILLWAGAEGTSPDEIEKAKFRVDKFGNLYAGSGYFSGTIITNASITAAKIKTAVIEGTNDSLKEDGTFNYPALNIINSANGIRFASSDQKDSKEYMSLTNKGLILKVPLIAQNLSLESDLNIKKLVMKEEEETVEQEKIITTGISLKPNYISLLGKDSSGYNKTLIQNTKEGLCFYQSNEFLEDWASNFENLKFSIGQQVIIGNDNTSTNLKLKGSLLLGEKAEYKMSKNKRGYDIYIK